MDMHVLLFSPVCWLNFVTQKDLRRHFLKVVKSRQSGFLNRYKKRICSFSTKQEYTHETFIEQENIYCVTLLRVLSYGYVSSNS